MEGDQALGLAELQQGAPDSPHPPVAITAAPQRKVYNLLWPPYPGSVFLLNPPQPSTPSRPAFIHLTSDGALSVWQAGRGLWPEVKTLRMYMKV